METTGERRRLFGRVTTTGAPELKKGGFVERLLKMDPSSGGCCGSEAAADSCCPQPQSAMAGEGVGIVDDCCGGGSAGGCDCC